MELFSSLLSLLLFASPSFASTTLGNPSDNTIAVGSPGDNFLANPSDNVIVSTQNANIIGQNLPLSNASIFYGVPYAKPPVDNLRFRPPQPIDQNLGTINATSRGNWCLRIELLPTPQDSEDCLNLDIVVPDRKDGDHELYPVIFFMHGGDFNGGASTQENGTELVQTSVEIGMPVVWVSINYRLNFFGFPAGKEAQAKGALNLGLLDMRLAMEWARENIACFGGDPDKVTIAGQSSGADGVGLQLLAYNGSMHESPLYRGAVLESGAIDDFQPIPFPNYPPWQDVYDKVVNETGCSNSSDTFECLRNLPVGPLYSSIHSIAIALAPMPGRYDEVYGPVVDGTFVAAPPSVLQAAGKFTKVPIIIGVTTDELSFAIPTNLNISSDAALYRLVNTAFPFIQNATITQLLADFPLSKYPNRGPPGSGIEWSRFVAIANAAARKCTVHSMAQSVAKYANVWKYRWNAVLPQDQVPAYEGIVHGSELSYLLQTGLYTNVSTADKILARGFQTSYISFAHFLDPNQIKGAPQWPKYTPGDDQVLVWQNPDANSVGIHAEHDQEDNAACAYIDANPGAFIR